MQIYKTLCDPWDNFNCTVDGCNYAAQSPRELLSHFRIVHSKTKGINSPCLFSKKCPHVDLFNTFDGLNSHLRKFHIEFFENEEADKCVDNTLSSDIANDTLVLDSSLVSTSKESTSVDDKNDNDDAGNSTPSKYYFNFTILLSYFDSGTENIPSDNSIESVSVAAGKFVMTMLADQKQTQVDMQLIMKGVQTLVHKAVDATLSEIRQLLVRESCSHVNSLNALQASDVVPDVFRGLRTQYSQINYFKNKFGLIMPTTITLPLIPADFGRHSTRRDQRFRPQTYVYISPLDQIEQLLNVKDFYDQIMIKPINPTEAGFFTRY